MVKVNFKTVQNKLFSLEVEGSETVADLKKKIQETQTFPVENQKLIYSGKILNDTANVDSLNIKEKDFLVVMVSKPKAKPAPAAAPAPAAPAPVHEASTSTPAPASAPAPAADAAAPATTEAPAATESAPASASTGTGFGGGSFLSGPELQSAISSMTEMGFERDLVMRAMKASYNNPDRAVEYLMTGDIPNVEGMGRPAEGGAPSAAPAAPSAPAAAAPTPAAAPAQPTPAPASAGSASDNLFAAAEAAMNRDRGTPAAAQGGMPGAAGGGGGGLDNAMLEQLAQSPQMQQLRQMVQENPALIQPLMQQIATSNPQLAQLINQNPQALYDLLGAGAGGEGEGEDDFLGPQVMHVDLTEAEAAAVERLEALGFERQMVLQAYMLCDKNEELAANFLFDSGDDEMA